ncbi:MAG: DNA polymerase III subunit alpha [Vampirovibrionales bacterium]|nr:DNA polymerase III subunit alpha [Vampirovibrionales bacterium]
MSATPPPPPLTQDPFFDGPPDAFDVAFETDVALDSPDEDQPPEDVSSSAPHAAAPGQAQTRPFAPLTSHSHYSMLEGASKIPDLIAIAQEKGFPAMGLTDSGVMYGALEFYNAAKNAGVKPLIGCELFVVEGDITDRSSRKPWAHLPLLCKNFTGYRNLVKLVSIGQLEGFYYKPRVNWELIEAHREGLIALSGDMAGPIARHLLRGATAEGLEAARRLKALFGDDFYIELHDHGKEAEMRLTQELLQIADELGVETVISNNSRFSRAGDHEVHNILLCMQEGKTLHDSNRTEVYGPEYAIKDADELGALFQRLDRERVERSLDATLAVAAKCDLEIPQGQSLLPAYPLPEGVTADAELERIAYECARQRYGAVEAGDAVDKRLRYELGVIAQMGFPAYFLIVWDFIAFARKNGIPVGPGRGSAAGSLVAYVLGITNLDPLAHNLLFERFLNPERVSMPDIDIDFCIERREEVIQYVRQLYGDERVCQIATFGTLAARAALKAVARVSDIPFAESDRLAKMIPPTPGTKLKDALADGMELRKEVDANADVKALVDLALKIEGTACNVGTHAAGVVIAKDPLTDIAPLQKSKDGQVICQYTMGDLEKLGLLKMDFLGLRNLTIIANTLRLVEAAHGRRIDIDGIPLDDPKVYAMLSAGDTDGVFQLESSGMKALERDLKPSTFEDINALVALFRPGPLNSGMVKHFVDRKHGREEIVFPHPDLEPILNSTYGTIVYQEQIMQIAQTLAGYSLGRADLLRRAMGKKKAEVMAKERDGFVEGCVARNVSKALANELFDAMTEFAAYCFNRSHSAAYAFVAYQTAFLKAHYPVEYLSALLSSVSGDLDKVQHYMLTARRMGIRVLPPDVTRSGADFTPDGESIRFGLATVKNVGAGVVDLILAERARAPFAGLEDFLRRVDPKALNRKTLESLIRGGALACFGFSRKQLLENVETMTAFAARIQSQQETGQASLFDLMAAAAPATGDAASPAMGGLILCGRDEEFSQEEIQQAEKELLGFYVTSHPLDSLAELLPLLVSHDIIELKDAPDQSEVSIGGLLSKTQKKLTRKGTTMLIATLEDVSGAVEIVAFQKTLDKVGEWLSDGARVMIHGKLSFRGDEGDRYSVMVDSASPIAAVRPLQLSFMSAPRYEDVDFLRRQLTANAGPNPVVIRFPDGFQFRAGKRFWAPDDRAALEAALRSHFGNQLRVG